MPWFEEQMEAWGEIVSAGLLQAAQLHKSEPFTLISHINYPGTEHQPIQQEKGGKKLSSVFQRSFNKFKSKLFLVYEGVFSLHNFKK